MASWPALLMAPPPKPWLLLPVRLEKLIVFCPGPVNSAPPAEPAVLPASLTCDSARAAPSAVMAPPVSMAVLPVNSEKLAVARALVPVNSPPPKAAG